MNIVMIASECVPFAKTGGLADVVGALPQILQRMGHQVVVVLPRYASIDYRRHGLAPHFEKLGVWMGDTQEWCAVHRASLGEVPVYFIEHNRYFDRWGLYHDSGFSDYRDNALRFGFMTRAALQLLKDLPFTPDIVHAHDWQTALASAYLKIWHWNDPVLGGASSVLTIHNLAYQGVYPNSYYNYLGLQWGNFTADKFEDHGAVNFLKGGIVYSDAVTTVSPTYARETLTPEGGCGLAPFLEAKGDAYGGILNGADYSSWSPEHDSTLPARYSVADPMGKAECKRALQQRLGLDVDPSIPLFGVVGRLVSQKGLDLLASCIDSILGQMRVQFAILGSGEKGLEGFYRELPGRWTGRVGSYIGYSEELAHQITAGSDFFVMPSRYEPCGLNQLYALRYGTLPIVRATGGLDDTIVQYDESSGEGTGFKFAESSARAVYYTVGWAVSTYYDRPEHLRRMIAAAMAVDYSWEVSAKAYVRLYEKVRARRR